MIKKINILLIVLSSIVSLYFVFTRDNNISLILKDLSIILTISAIYIVQKLFKIKINEYINFIYIVFIVLAHLLGSICELYNYIYWYDKFVHFMSGIVSSLCAIYLLIRFNKFSNVFFDVLFIVSFAMLVASCWEIFEFTSSIVFNCDPQKVLLTGASDTMGDIIVALLGSILISICYLFEKIDSHYLLISRYIELI